MCLDAVGGGDGLVFVDCSNGVTDPDPCQLTVVHEVTGVGQPGFDEQIETFVQAALGMRIEIGSALSGLGARAASLGLGAAVPPLG